jgi:protein TonB
MSQALVARAASFGASALLMGGVVLLALTMTYAVQEWNIGEAPAPVQMEREPPPPPDNPITRPQTTPMQENVDVSPLPPLDPVSSANADPAPYLGPVAPVGPVEITAPHWQRRPSDLTRFYPGRALGRNIEGEVVLNCLVRISGLLDCDVVSESPAGWGFGEAAQRIARAHRMVPATRSGIAVEGRYVMRVPFQID